MLNLRNTTLKDIPLLQTLEAAAAQRFLAIPELAILADSNVTDSQTHELSITQELAWLVEDARGSILGFCYTQELAGSLYLAEISSHPAARGLGVGRMLVAHVRQVAARRGLSGVTLTTYTDIPWNAPWYEREGFIILEPSSYCPELKNIVQSQVTELMLLPRCVMWSAPLKKDNDYSRIKDK
ncbi:GNAT family N-acetyltransferase [Klebsiella sp. BIGb0407]|uniref:GNAT family N-acetyltransferase n=1 Tax=Klebsiella sp. BIGb0407 TaxID=2940603 RepID=UPI002168685B|nr:GNAT family N-acetyltransferase [Klebsiella sp. BIGb0407]MCS3429739.1 ribosomal protein S18 acetylase RimI-like enzyme [Klebsiella sp. BIGb0407]